MPWPSCRLGWDVLNQEVMLCTLKALALTPLVLRRLLLALKDVSLAGSIGSLTSLFSARDNDSSRASLENAPSSISEIRFPVRSILFRVTVDEFKRNMLLWLLQFWASHVVFLSHNHVNVTPNFSVPPSKTDDTWQVKKSCGFVHFVLVKLVRFSSLFIQAVTDIYHIVLPVLLFHCKRL